MKDENLSSLFCRGAGGTLLFGFSSNGRAIWCAVLIRMAVNRPFYRLSNARRMRNTEVEMEMVLDKMACRNRQWDFDDLFHTSGGRHLAGLRTGRSNHKLDSAWN
jgi:hypothetical protein